MAVCQVVLSGMKENQQGGDWVLQGGRWEGS